MGNLFAHAAAWVTQNPSWTDAILAAGILIQGELTILLGTYLAINGSVTWEQFFGTTLVALVLGELCVYAVGRALRLSRFGWRFHHRKKGNKRTQFYTHHLKQDTGKLLLIGKFIPATNFLLIFLSGWTRIAFKDFFKAYLKSVLFWFGSIAVLAYFAMSGVHYLKSSNIFRDAEIGIVVVLLALFGGEFVLKKLFNRYEDKEEKAGTIRDTDEEEADEKHRESQKEP